MTSAHRRLALPAGLLLAACASERRAPPTVDDVATPPAVERVGTHEGGVLAVAALAGERVLSSGADGVVRLWDGAGTELARLEMPDASPASSLAAADDGQVALLPAASGVLVWDVAARAESTRLAGAGTPSRVAIAPDGRAAAAAAADGELTIWPLPEGAPPVRLRPHAGRVVGLAIVGGAAAALLSAGDDDRLCATPLAEPRPRCVDAPGEGTSAVAFSADGRRAASGNRAGEVRLWDVASGAALGTFDVHDGEVTALAFTADGAHLVTGGADRRATLLDAATGRVLRRLLAPGTYVSAVAVTGDAALIGTDDGSVLRWTLPE